MDDLAERRERKRREADERLLAAIFAPWTEDDEREHDQ